MKYLFIYILLFLNYGPMASQIPCACCSDSYNKFDFWIGDWIVNDTVGQHIGNSSIEKIENGCIISEKWKGKSGYSGRSYNYYQSNDSTWNQIWIDNSGNQLILKGDGLDGKAMNLMSDAIQGENGMYRNQITWTLQPDSTVIQIWNIINLEGQVQKELFKGIYHRRD